MKKRYIIFVILIIAIIIGVGILAVNLYLREEKLNNTNYIARGVNIGEAKVINVSYKTSVDFPMEFNNCDANSNCTKYTLVEHSKPRQDIDFVFNGINYKWSATNFLPVKINDTIKIVYDRFGIL